MKYPNSPRLSEWLKDKAGWSDEEANVDHFDITERFYAEQRHLLQIHGENPHTLDDHAAFRCLTLGVKRTQAGTIAPGFQRDHITQQLVNIQTGLKDIRRWIFLLLALGLIMLALAATGHAQGNRTLGAIVVTTCGTPPANFPTAGNPAPATVDVNGNWCTPTGSGGTSSIFGNASPSAGTAVGARDTGGNMQPLSLDGAGVGQNLNVDCKVGCSAAADTVGSTVALNALNAAASVALAGQNGVVVTFATGGTLAGTTVVPEISLDGGATYVSTLLHGPVFIDQTTFAEFTSLSNPSGTSQFIAWDGPVTNVRVRVSVFGSGTVNATLRAVTNRPYQLMQGADTNGIPRFVLVDSSGNVQTSVATALPTGANTIGAVTQASGPWSVAGNVASGGADSGNPLKTGGVFNTTQPTVANTQRVDTQATSRGGLIVATGVDAFTSRMADNSGNGITSTGNALDINIKSGGTGYAQGSTTSGQVGTLVQCAATTSAPSYTTATTDPVSCDLTGAIRVNVIGGVATGYAQGSTTSGQLGPLIQAAVTTAAPSYTTAQTSPLSLTTAGGLRLDLASVAGTATINGGVSGSQGVGGLAGSGTALAGNPVLIGAANGANAATLQTDGNTNLKVVAPLITYLSSLPYLSNNATHDFMIDEASNLKVATGVVTQTLTAWTNATGLNTTQNIYTSDGPKGVVVQLDQTSTITQGAINFQTSYDGVNWSNVAADQVLDPTSTTLAQISMPYTLQASTNKPFLILPHGAIGMRIILSTVILGTGSVTPYFTLLYADHASEVVVYSPSGTAFHVNCDAGCSSSPAPNDNTAFTAGTTPAGPVACFTHAVRDTLTDGREGAIACNPNRALLVQLEDSSKNPINATSNALNVFLSGSNATVNTNVAQINGTTINQGNGTSGNGDARINIASDNTAIANWGQGATGAAVPTGAGYQAGNGSGNLTGVTVCDNWTAISQTSGTQLFAGASSKKTYICAINLVTATAQNVALVAGTGSVCATSTHTIAGGTTAATGWNLAANGGLTQGSGTGVIMQAATAADNVCLLQSGSGQVSGAIAWTQY